jgi:class 3 adenylate cyclase
MPINRKLVAVVMADVVGYSRLMERDESGTHQRLRALNDDLFTPKIAEHGGRTVKTAGDGMLLEFPSATSALRCAVEIQREMGVRNLYVAPDERIEFRIGINLGDIIVEGNDIIGDGVNVAARLETLPNRAASASRPPSGIRCTKTSASSSSTRASSTSRTSRRRAVGLARPPLRRASHRNRGRRRRGHRRNRLVAMVAAAADDRTDVDRRSAATIDRRAPAVRRTGERSRPRDTLGVAGRRRGERTRQQCPRRAAAAKAELMKRVPDFTISRLDAKPFLAASRVDRRDPQQLPSRAAKGWRARMTMCTSGVR